MWDMQLSQLLLTYLIICDSDLDRELHILGLWKCCEKKSIITDRLISTIKLLLLAADVIWGTSQQPTAVLKIWELKLELL